MNDAPAHVGAGGVVLAALTSWLPQVRDFASILASVAALIVAWYAISYYRSHKEKQ